MKYKVEQSGMGGQYSSLLKIAFEPDDMFKARASSMMSFGGDISTSTTTTRSLWKAITTFENYPITKVRGKATGNGGVVTFTPPLPGEVTAVEPNERELKVQSLGFLGAPEKYSIDLNRNGMYKNDSLATLGVTETDEDGDMRRVFISGFGGVTKVDLGKEERTHISEDYILAMDGTVSFNRSESTDIKGSAFGTHSTPNLDIAGPGSVYLHARSPFKLKRVLNKLDEY